LTTVTRPTFVVLGADVLLTVMLAGTWVWPTDGVKGKELFWGGCPVANVDAEAADGTAARETRQATAISSARLPGVLGFMRLLGGSPAGR
jgi:hypothetical protein